MEISYLRNSSQNLEASQLHASNAIGELPDLQLYKELSFHQIHPNPKTFIVNKTQMENFEKFYKETPPATSFAEVFTLKNSVLICKVESQNIFVCKRNIFDEAKLVSNNTNISNVSEVRSSQSSVSTEYEYTLEFPVSVAKHLFCVELTPNNPILIIITSLGHIYELSLQTIEQNSKDGELNIPCYEADTNFSIVTNAIHITDPLFDQEKGGFSVCLSCKDGHIYYLNLFLALPREQASNRRVLNVFDFRIDKNLLNTVVPDIILGRVQRRDYIVDMCYLTHKIIVGVTASSMIKVFNLHRRACILSYQLPADLSGRNTYKVKAIASNPYFLRSSNKHNFLICVYVTNSLAHTEIKQFNLSFAKSEKNGTACDFEDISFKQDLGVETALTEVGDFPVGDMVMDMDLNSYGMIISAFSYEKIEDRIIYHRFDKELSEKLLGLENIVDEVRTSTERRKTYFSSDHTIEGRLQSLLEYPNVVSNDLINRFLSSKPLNTSNSSPTRSHLSARKRLLEQLQNKLTATAHPLHSSSDQLEYGLTEFYDFCRKESIIDKVIVPQNNDFFPFILRSREINALVSTTNAESYSNTIARYSSYMEKAEDIFNLIDTFSSSPTLNFLSMLIVLRRSVGNLQDTVAEYIRIHHESGHFVEPITSYLQRQVLPEITFNDQAALRKIIKTFSSAGTPLDSLLNQIIKEIKQSLDSQKESEGEVLFERRDIWGQSIVYLLSQSLRDYVDSAFGLVCLLILLIKFTLNAHHVVPNGFEVEPEVEMTLKDLAQTLVGLKMLNRAHINEYALEKLNSRDQKSYSYIDQLTCFCITQKSKYFPPEFEYSSKDASRWYLKVHKNLLNAVNFDAFTTDFKNVPNILRFLAEQRQHKVVADLSNLIECKNPAYQYFRAIGLNDKNQDKLEMMKSLMYVAAFINRMSNKSHELNRSLYDAVWYRSENFSAISQNVVTNYASPLVNFLQVALKYSFSTEPCTKLSLSQFGLSLSDLYEGTSVHFTKELFGALLSTHEYAEGYNLVYLLPEASTDFEVCIRHLYHTMSKRGQIHQFAKLPFSSSLFVLAIHAVEDAALSGLYNIENDVGKRLTPETIYFGLEASIKQYHDAISFFLDRELHRNVLHHRKNILIECIFCLDSSSSGLGYLSQSKAKTRVKRSKAEIKSQASVWNVGADPVPEKHRNSSYDEEDVEELADLTINNIDLIGREKLNQSLQLIEARLVLQEKLNIGVQESAYDSISLIIRLLIIGGEYNQAFSFLKAFPQAAVDMISALLVKFMIKKEDEDNVNLESGEKELTFLLEKAMKVLDSNKILEAIKFTANSLLKIQKSLKKPLELPKFLIDLFWKHNPTPLLTLYINYELTQPHLLLQNAVFTLDRILQHNQLLCDEPSRRKKTPAIYVDPAIIKNLLEICSKENYSTDDIASDDSDDEADRGRKILHDRAALKRFVIAKFKI